jgi:hypothetical protein
MGEVNVIFMRAFPVHLGQAVAKLKTLADLC